MNPRLLINPKRMMLLGQKYPNKFAKSVDKHLKYLKKQLGLLIKLTALKISFLATVYLAIFCLLFLFKRSQSRPLWITGRTDLHYVYILAAAVAELRVTNRALALQTKFSTFVEVMT